MPDDPPARPRLHAPFGEGGFGQAAERFARFFGTPTFIIGQTIAVVVWIALNAAAFGFRWDPYPFILLNLAFSTQAAYAAPLILLAQTRQADRDKAREDAFNVHREAQERQMEGVEAKQVRLLETEEARASQRGALAEQQVELLRRNTELTEQVVRLTEELHATVCRPPA